MSNLVELEIKILYDSIKSYKGTDLCSYFDNVYVSNAERAADHLKADPGAVENG